MGVIGWREINAEQALSVDPSIVISWTVYPILTKVDMNVVPSKANPSPYILISNDG
jgi:hypothetical protein